MLPRMELADVTRAVVIGADGDAAGETAANKAAHAFAALIWSRVSHLPKLFFTGFRSLRPLKPVPRPSTMTTMYWSSETT